MNRRTLATILLTTLGAGAVEARERTVRADEVPANVRAALKGKYPTARIRSYSVEHFGDTTTYEGRLEVDGRSIDVEVSTAGLITAEEELLSTQDLPDAVATALRTSRFGRSHIVRSERLIQNQAADDPRYELLIREGRTHWELTYDRTGRLLKTERVRTSD